MFAQVIKAHSLADCQLSTAKNATLDMIQMRSIPYGLAVLAGLLAGPLLALAVSKPVPGEIMRVIGPDLSAQQATIRNAGGQMVGPEMARFGALVLSENDNFAATVLEAGAWFVVDGRPMALLCGVDA